jgi:hypothetical protein
MDRHGKTIAQLPRVTKPQQDDLLMLMREGKSYSLSLKDLRDYLGFSNANS